MDLQYTLLVVHGARAVKLCRQINPGPNVTGVHLWHERKTLRQPHNVYTWDRVLIRQRRLPKRTTIYTISNLIWKIAPYNCCCCKSGVFPKRVSYTLLQQHKAKKFHCLLIWVMITYMEYWEEEEATPNFHKHISCRIIQKILPTRRVKPPVMSSNISTV